MTPFTVMTNIFVTEFRKKLESPCLMIVDTTSSLF